MATLTLILGLVISHPYLEDTLIFTLDYYNLPPDFDFTVFAGIEDFNRDGWPDIVFLNQRQTSLLCVNEGSDTDGDSIINFRLERNLTDSLYAYGGYIYDFNSDGFPDIFIGRGEEYGYGRQNLLLINDGNGGFLNKSTNLPTDSYHTRSVALADVDNDGRIDIVLANGRVDFKGSGNLLPEENTIYWNRGDTDHDGVPNFIDVKPWSEVKVTQSVVTADVNNDGLIDIFFVNYLSENSLYLNMGIEEGDSFPSFLRVTDSLIPEESGLSERTRAALFKDLDLDGDIDLVIGVDSSKIKLYVNEGEGYFSDSSHLIPDSIAKEMIYIWDILGEDINGDSLPDLLLAGEKNFLLLNNPQEPLKFSDGSNLIVQGDFTTLSLAGGDLDKDGSRDLVFGDLYEQNRIQIRRESGFQDVTTTLLPADWGLTRDVIFADLNGDGYEDILVLDQKEGGRIYKNELSGRYLDVTPVPLRNLQEDFVRAKKGDADGDGDIDLVIATLYSVYLLRNLGDFDFELETISTSRGYISDILFVDLTGDGNLDIYVATYRFFIGEEHKIWVNDGEGNFSDSTSSLIPPIRWYLPNCVESLDYDGDGDIDIVVGAWDISEGGLLQHDSDRLFENMGDGHLVDVSPSPFEEADLTNRVISSDVNLDGNPDLFFANYTSDTLWNPYGQSRLYINEGGNFFLVEFPKDSFGIRDAVFTDFDLDGDPDIVIVNWMSPDYILPRESAVMNRPYLYENLGNSVFVLREDAFPIVSETGENITSVDASDINGDGYPDIITGVDGQNRLYINHRGTGYSEKEPSLSKWIAAYPTVTKGILRLKCGRIGLLRVVLFDIIGRKLKEEIYSDPMQEVTFKLPRELPSGVYLISLNGKMEKILLMK